MAKKLKAKRKFLNPFHLDHPGAISIDPYYSKIDGVDSLSSVQLNIGDCNRTIHIDFPLNCNYSDMKTRKVDLDNSKAKIKILKDTIDELYEYINATELKPNEIDKNKKNEKSN